MTALASPISASKSRRRKGRRRSREDSTSIISFERVLMAGVLALLLWIPVPIGSNNDWSMAFLVLLIGLLGLGWALHLITDQRQRKFQAVRSALPMLLLLLGAQLWVLFQLLSGTTADPGSTFQYLMLGIAFSLLFLLIVGLFNTRKRMTLLLSVLLISGVAQAFFGALMTLSGVEWLAFQPKEYGRGLVTGTFVNRNHMAGYLEMTLACGIGLLMALRDGRAFHWHHLAGLLIGPKARIRLALVIMVIALVMTHSRGGNTAFFSSLIIVGLLFTLMTPTHRVRNALLLGSLLLIDLMIVSQYFGLEQLKERLVQTQLEDKVVEGVIVRRENVDRDDIALYALPQLAERWLVGYGAGAFEASFQRFPGPDVKARFDHAHNDFLQFVIEYGVVGSLLLGAFVLGALIQAIRAMMQSDSLYRSGIGLGAGMGILSILIHSASDFNLQIPANAATFVVLCAIATQAPRIR